MTEHKIGCSGKKRFTTFGLAARSAKRLRRRDDEAHVEAYHCTSCAGFHVGEARAYGRRDARKQEERQ